MNSPHSNLGSSTYQNPKGSNADVWLSSPSLGPTTSVYGSSSSGLSRARLGKIRRRVSSQDPRSTQALGSHLLDRCLIPTRPVSSNPVRATDIGGSGLEGFNYASSGNEAFVFGANMPSNFSSNLNFHRENSSGNLDSNTRLVDMDFSVEDSSFYRDGADRGFFSFQSDDKKSTSVENLASELPDKIRKLKIDGSGNAQTLSNAKGVNLQRENYSGNLNANTHSININFSGAESSFCSEGANSDFFVFESGNKKTIPVERSTSKLPAEIRKLKIDDYSGNPQSSNNAEGLNYSASERNGAHYRFSSGENFSNAFDVGLAKELPNVMKKLNIKDPLDCSRISENADDHKKFAFGSSNKVGDSMAGKLKSTLHDRMRNLNIKEPSKSHGDNENMNVHVDSSDKKSFVSGNSRTTSQLDEIRKISTMVENTSAQTKAGEFPINSANETWTHNFGNTKFHDGSTSIPMGFTFQAGEQRRTSSSDQVPQFNQNDNKLNGNEKKTRLDFTSKWSGLGTPHVEFRTPEPKGNLFSGLNRTLEPKGESVRGSRTKKKKGNLSKPPLQTRLVQDSVLNEKTQEIDESFESYSPMDISPCKETVSDNNHSRETSVTSDDAFHLGDNYASNESYPISHLNNAVDEDLVTEVDAEITELKGEGSSSCSNRGPYAEGPSEDYVSGAETESFKSAAEQLDYTSDTATSSDMFVTALDTAEVSSNARIDRKDSDDRMHFSFASISEDKGRNSFTFAAPSFAQVHSSAPTRQHRRKDRLKVGLDALSSTSNAKASYSSFSVQFFPFSGTSSLLSPRQGKKGDVPTFLRKSGDQNEPVKDKEVKQETSSAVASIAAQEACEKWRMRGNQAYANGDLSKAEDYYTQGLNCISQQETSRSCLRALMLSYSNRAAARMSLGRMREALEDCKLAAALDPNFLRVQVRAANCYLALGEVESALPHFMKCLQSGSDVCVDRKLQLEASEGLEKAQKVSECMKLSAELLQHKTSTYAERALEIIAEALTISSYSEKLLQMKADALYMLQRYEDVIHLCKKTLFSAQMGASRHDIECHSQNRDGPEQGSSLFRIWKFSLIIKSYFLLGRLEEVLDFLKKQEDSVAIIMDRNKGQTLESVLPLVGTIRELLRHKSAGNEAFKSGKHAEALEHYTAAVSCNIESRPFVAICFGNRAASYRAMGHIIDAIADYSLAIALDGHYLKAISRRASLYETIRDYEQAAMDLRRLLSLLTKQVEEKAARCGTSDRMSCMDELRQTQHRLSVMEEEARKEIPLNIYLILGVEPSGTASEIRKAYRKAALKHHPDKVGQSLARSESGDDGLWKEIAEEVHKDADRLFKMIGEAYAILSDPTKRSRYDLEEEMRNGHNRGSASNITRTHTAAQKHPFERSNSSSRRNWQEAYTSYRNTQPRG